MKNNQGFTLVETMVALLILSVLGLMASQGLGGAFRVKDTVEDQIKDHEAMVIMIKHLQNDCETMVKNIDEKLLPTFIQGNKYTWVMRHTKSAQASGWQFVGYILEDNTLKRYITETYLNKQQVAGILETLSKDPDLGLASAQISYQLTRVVNYNMTAYWHSFTRKSASGLQVSISRIGDHSPLSISCIAEGKI